MEHWNFIIAMMRITPDIRMLGKMTMTQQKCLLKEEQLESASIWLEKGATTCLRNEHFPMVHSTLSKGKRMNVKANKFNLEITQMRLMKFIIGLMIVILAMSKNAVAQCADNPVVDCYTIRDIEKFEVLIDSSVFSQDYRNSNAYVLNCFRFKGKRFIMFCGCEKGYERGTVSELLYKSNKTIGYSRTGEKVIYILGDRTTRLLFKKTNNKQRLDSNLTWFASINDICYANQLPSHFIGDSAVLQDSIPVYISYDLSWYVVKKGKICILRDDDVRNLYVLQCYRIKHRFPKAPEENETAIEYKKNQRRLTKDILLFYKKRYRNGIYHVF